MGDWTAQNLWAASATIPPRHTHRTAAQQQHAHSAPAPALPANPCQVACPPLCAGALWPMPAWVWRDVRSVCVFFLSAPPGRLQFNQNHTNTVRPWRGGSALLLVHSEGLTCLRSSTPAHTFMHAHHASYRRVFRLQRLCPPLPPPHGRDAGDDRQARANDRGQRLKPSSAAQSALMRAVAQTALLLQHAHGRGATATRPPRRLAPRGALHAATARPARGCCCTAADAQEHACEHRRRHTHAHGRPCR